MHEVAPFAMDVIICVPLPGRTPGHRLGKARNRSDDENGLMERQNRLTVPIRLVAQGSPTETPTLTSQSSSVVSGGRDQVP